MANTLIIANRGASRQAPENTVPAIQKALEAQADLIALDVQVTRDDQPVLFADSHLDRTTNRVGRLNQLTLKEVQELDAGSWFDARFAGTRVPTLAQALAAAGAARLMLNLPELRAGTPLAANVQKALAGRARPAEDVLLLPDSESLKTFRALAPDFGYALALGEKVHGWVHVEKAVKLGLKVIRPYRAQLDAAVVRQAHEKNLLVFAHFADKEDEMRELLRLRVDGILTGRPELLKQLREEEGAAPRQA